MRYIKIFTTILLSLIFICLISCTGSNQSADTGTQDQQENQPANESTTNQHETEGTSGEQTTPPDETESQPPAGSREGLPEGWPEEITVMPGLALSDKPYTDFRSALEGWESVAFEGTFAEGDIVGYYNQIPGWDRLEMLGRGPGYWMYEAKKGSQTLRLSYNPGGTWLVMSYQAETQPE
jgi:hypothetical protein